MTDTNIPGERYPMVRTRLTRRLVSEERMAESLAYLFLNLQRYTLLVEVQRSERDSKISKLQDPDIILFEHDPLQVRNKIDPRLLKAHSISILATTADRGTARIEVTDRTVYRWKDTPEISRVIEEFNNQLKSGTRPTRALIRTYSFGAVYWTLAMVLLAGVILSHYGSAGVISANIIVVCSIAYFIIDAIIIWRSKALRIWPKELTRDWALPKLVSIHLIRLSAETRRLLFVGIVTAIVTAIITRLLGG